MRLPAAVRALRPHQWTKNLFVFAPILFEHRFDFEGRNLRTVAAFAIFCMLASGIYLVNDVLDREADRAHPRKRLRPIAAGELSVAAALVLAAALLAGGLAWARFGLANNPLTLVCLVYVVLQLAYSTFLKRIVIVDVLCIASGFVLRLLAGSSAAWVNQSAWILVCTIFVSLFLALCKRRHEVVTLGDEAGAHREALSHYPVPLLDQLISTAASATLVTYALYTVDRATVEAHRLMWNGRSSPILAATIPFVIFGVFRYLYLVHTKSEGGSPTRTLLADRPSLVNGALYLAAVLGIFLHFGA